MISPQDKLALIQQLDSTIIENNTKEISGQDLNDFFHLLLDKVTSDPSCLIPRLDLSFNNGAYDLNDLIGTPNGVETCIRVRPQSSIAFLGPYTPEVWLFRRGRSLADRTIGGSTGKKTKWLHPTDRDVTDRIGWSKYGIGSRGEQSDWDGLSQSYKGINFNLKTEWPLAADLYEVKNSLGLRLEAERYFGVWNTSDSNTANQLLDFMGLNLLPTELRQNNLQIRTRLRSASMKANRNRLIARLNETNGNYDIISSPDKLYGISWEFKLAIVINHPTIQRTKIIGPMSDSFLFKVHQTLDKTTFTACLK